MSFMPDGTREPSAMLQNARNDWLEQGTGIHVPIQIIESVDMCLCQYLLDKI